MFGASELDFFGLRITKNGVSVQESKAEALVKAEAPKTPSEVRSFLGLANYCSRFLKDLAKVVYPLRQLTKAGNKWEWNAEHENAFQTVKSSLTTEALAYYDPKLRTELNVDASNVGLGAVFCQYDEVNPEVSKQVVMYASRTLSDVESRYSQVELEALAVVWACERFHLYLIGSQFDIVTDNKAVQLIYGNERSQPKARIERWCLRLVPYDFKVIHRPGLGNIADYLSRNPISKHDVHDHEDMAEKYVSMISQTARPQAIKMDILANETRCDSQLQMVLESLKSPRTNLGAYEKVRNDLSITSTGIVLRGNRICIPKALQSQVIELAHHGHQGIVRTKKLVREHVWFPGIDKEVEETIANCRECQVNTDKFQLQPLQMSPMPNGPWSELSIDLFGPLRTGKHLLVIIDDYSRYPVVKSVSSTSAKACVPLISEIFSTFGTPEVVRSDNGAPFNSRSFEEFAEELGFKHRRITPAWPRANGVVESFMKNLGKVLRNSTTNGSKFEDELIKFLRSYRATPHSSTKIAPQELLFKSSATTSLLPKYRSATYNDHEAKCRMKAYTDRKLKAKVTQLKPGDYVLLRNPESILGKALPVYDPKPFRIESIRGTQATIVQEERRLLRNVSLLQLVRHCQVESAPNKTNQSQPNKPHKPIRMSTRIIPQQPQQQLQQQLLPQPQIEEPAQQHFQPQLPDEMIEEPEQHNQPFDQNDQEGTAGNVTGGVEPGESTDASFQSTETDPTTTVTDSTEEYVLPKHVNQEPSTSTRELRVNPKKRTFFDALYS